MSTPRSLTLPAGVRSQSHRLPDGNLAVLQADAVRPVGSFLLVHGFTGSKEDLLPLVAPLTEAGYSVLAPDLPGQFESTGWSPAYFAEPALADLLVSLARTLPAPVHLVGHSLGGLISRRAVLRSPGSFGSLMLLCSGPAAIPEHKRPELRALIQALPHTPISLIWAVKQAGGTESPDPTIADFVARRFLANDPVAMRALAELLTQEPDRTAELATVLAANNLPALVIHGEADDAWPPQTQREMAVAIGAAYEVISDAAHSPAVENPADTVKALLRQATAAGPAETTTRCVGAVISSEGRILLVRRGHEPAVGKWSLPGGRVESGEDDRAALTREISEETGLSADIGRRLGTVRRPGPRNTAYEIHDYLVVTSGRPTASSDADAVGWFSREQAQSLGTTDGLIRQLDEWEAWD